MKLSYSLRAFGIYFIILGSLIWFTLDNAIERLNDSMRQSAESVLVDTANILASVIENELDPTLSTQPNTAALSQVFVDVKKRQLSAQIYQINKASIDTEVYVTDAAGVVIYDSSGLHLGEDYSNWRDVNLTLAGEYGARTSFIDQAYTEPDDPKAMVIAAPITLAKNIIGSVSVMKPINSLEGHLIAESKQLQRYAFALLLLALIIGYLLSLWFTHSINRIALYANDMAEGKSVTPPLLQDSRLNDLTHSISNMRSQLDGKEYVEDYIHSLTHELKTPITSIRGAVELMNEDMPREDRQLFLNNIDTSNQRMARLVERMLSLAQLESLNKLVSSSEFDLLPTVHRLIQERKHLIENKNVKISVKPLTSFDCVGDKVLIGQAFANLLDNAINFSSGNSEITVELMSNDSAPKPEYSISIHNHGESIPDYALAKMYDRFFSLPSPHANQQNSKSTGLGLSFVREIMKLHNGSVSVMNVDQGVFAALSWPIGQTQD
jgi:two-component system sensor histidine kinase CreC